MIIDEMIERTLSTPMGRFIWWGLTGAILTACLILALVALSEGAY